MTHRKPDHRRSRAETARRTTRTVPDRSPEQSPPARLFVLFSICWLFLSLLEIGLRAFVAYTADSDSAGAASQQITSAASGLASLAAVTALVGGVAIGARWLTGRIGPAVLVLGFGAAAAIAWIALLAYGASWALYWNTGLFLDRGALSFWLSQPVQMLHWVYPPLAALVVLSASAATVAIIWLIRWAARQDAMTQRAVARTALAGVSTCTLLVMVSWLGSWPGSTPSRSPFAEEAIGVPSGPIGALLRSISSQRALTPESLSDDLQGTRSGDVRVVRRPLISIEQYLADVDRARQRPLNVVMIQVESLRSDQLRIYGGTRDVMPTLDALAREARVFTNAYVQASHSNCADPVPLSSHYPLRSPEMINSYPETPTYPRVLIYDILKALGYKTAIFSSQNERWGGMIHYHRARSLDRFFHAETFAGPTYAPWQDAGFAEWVKQTEGAGSVDDRHTTDEAIRWIDSVAGGPFFLHMNLQSSHLPYVVPPDFRRPFGPQTLDFAILWGRLPLDKVNIVKNRYADSLFYIDMQIARLFDQLRKRRLWDRTVIVIGGDNGEAFYEHGFAAHASWLFNEVVKVPMIIRAPDVAAALDNRPAMFLDVPPSLLELLRLPPHPSFQGISLFEPSPRPDRSLYMIAQTPAAYESAIVRSRYKLHFVEEENRYVLNDLVEDPGERRNVGPQRPEVLRDLRQRLLRWRAEQLAYYADLQRQAREYPPVIED